MIIQNDWKKLRDRILTRLRPCPEEALEIKRFYTKTISELSKSLEEAGISAKVEIHGSVARGTWLSGDKDIDFFLILDSSLDKSYLYKALDVVKRYLGAGWIESYAEHPYIRAEREGFDVEFIPCFRAYPRKRIISSTDRTPLHTQFVNDNLNEELRDEVRLLKQFMRGVGVYGAEVKIGGFSGYLCELLIIKFKSFESVLEAASNWKRSELIKVLEDSNLNGQVKQFKDPLIVSDPVDSKRNVASAVSDKSMWTFVAAARSFLKKPLEKYFYPEEAEAAPSSILELLRNHGSKYIFIYINDDSIPVPDILWGQLYKAERAISKFLKVRDFPVIRSASWSDEASQHILLFELAYDPIPQTVLSMGPPVEMAESSERFLKTHLHSDKIAAGPWIEGGRWWILLKRKEIEAQTVLEEGFKRGAERLGVPKRLSRLMSLRSKMLTDGGIEDYLKGDFKKFLYQFLKGRPNWLDGFHTSGTYSKK